MWQTKHWLRIVLFSCLALLNQSNETFAAPLRAVSDWKLPLPPGEYEVTQGDKDSCYDTHCVGHGNHTTLCAIDLWVDNIAGMPVLAPASGTVIDLGYQQIGGGNYIYILHDDGLVSHYQHLQKIYVGLNDRLEQGQPFARVGATGSSAARAWQEHLHFTALSSRQGDCVKLVSLDGNTNFATNAKVRSTNVQKGNLPDDSLTPITPIPPIPTVPPPAAPDRPALGDPGNNTSLSPSAAITLRWNPSANATQYKVETWGNAVTGCDWQASTTCRIGQLPPGTLHWHVKARNANGESDWSDTWSFTIQDAPRIITITPTWTPTITLAPPVSGAGRPTLTSPSNGASLAQSTSVTLNWIGAANATQYKVELWGGPYSTMTPCDWQSWTSCQIGTMWLGTMSWHVKARNASGQEGAWSDTWSFTIRQDITITPTWTPTRTATPTLTPVAPPARPNRPTLSSPGNQEFLSNRTDITLVWNSVANATQYRVEAWGSNNRTCEWQNGTSCRITGLSTGSMGWHVKARNANGDESDWSDTWTFVIRPPEPPPSPTGNLAPKARREPDGIASGNAFDGNLATFWTNGLGHRFNLRLTLAETATVNRLIVWDRPQNSPDNQQINQLIVSLSNGWSKRFDMNSGGPRCIDVTLSSPQTISWVNLKADDASGNNGLSEMEIWAGGKTTGLNCANRGQMP